MFWGLFPDLACPPPSIDTVTGTDHSQPVPEDDEFDSRPDQATMEAAIADFLKRLEVQENQGYRDLDEILSSLPVPRKVDHSRVSVTAAMEAGMQPHMDDEESRRFTPSEVLLYQHAQDRRCIGLKILWSMMWLYTVKPCNIFAVGPWRSLGRQLRYFNGPNFIPRRLITTCTKESRAQFATG